MNMPKTIYMRDDFDGGIEMTSESDCDAHKYVLCIDETSRKDAILALCARLQAAAIKCDTYHVFVSYAPHVASFTVFVERVDTDYLDEYREIDRMIDKCVYLDMDGALDQLTDIVDQLQRLGIDV